MKFTNFIKENKNMLIAIILIVVLFPIIILSPSDIGVIPFNVGLEIVSYGGSIIGGFLTLYGVWWTIKYEKEELEKNKNEHNLQRKEELFLQYKPLLKCDIHYSTNKNNLFYFYIKNIGRGELINIDISFSNVDLLKCKTLIGPEILLPNNKLAYLIECTSEIKEESKIKIIIKGNDYLKNKITTTFTFNTNVMGNGIINLNLKNIEYDNDLKY